MAPDGMQKRVAQATLKSSPAGAKEACILVIDGLDREHNAALNQIGAYVRTIAARKRAPALAPLRRPVAQLVESCPNSSRPFRRCRTGGLRVRGRRRCAGRCLLGHNKARDTESQQECSCSHELFDAPRWIKFRDRRPYFFSLTLSSGNGAGKSSNLMVASAPNF